MRSGKLGCLDSCSDPESREIDLANLSAASFPSICFPSSSEHNPTKITKHMGPCAIARVSTDTTNNSIEALDGQSYALNLRISETKKNLIASMW